MVALWEGAARYFSGFEVPEQADLVDYLTTHDNRSESQLKGGQTIQDVVHDLIVQARFCYKWPQNQWIDLELGGGSRPVNALRP